MDTRTDRSRTTNSTSFAPLLTKPSSTRFRHSAEGAVRDNRSHVRYDHDGDFPRTRQVPTKGRRDRIELDY